VQIGGELAQPCLDRFKVGAEFVRSVPRLQPAFVDIWRVRARRLAITDLSWFVERASPGIKIRAYG
jgi:hypothetical protein